MLATVILAASLMQPAATPGIVAEVRVHGNAVTPDEEVIRLAGVKIGVAFDEATIPAIEARLRGDGRFKDVEVLKRFASISDPSQVLLVIVVDDGPVKVEIDPRSGAPRTVRRRAPPLMVQPLLSAEDGYGVAYGVQFALPGIAGSRSRVSVPLTWGGEKKAAAEVEKDFRRGPLNRIAAGLSASRRTNPFFEEHDDRVRLFVRGERDIVRHLRVGVVGGTERVSFLNADDRFNRIGADVVLDTRLDPMLARNAVFARAGVERLNFSNGGAIARREFEIRGYLGLPGQGILVVRALREDSDRPLPGYLQPLLGGMANLRGFRAGTAVGDTLAAGSLELRLPLTSPLSIGKLGVSVFTDAATVYGHGEHLGDQTFRRGVGGGVWFSAAFLRLNIAVAHGVGSSTRAHIGTTLTF
jgi:outer membrane protein assembly factor BamA